MCQSSELAEVNDLFLQSYTSKILGISFKNVGLGFLFYFSFCLSSSLCVKYILSVLVPHARKSSESFLFCFMIKPVSFIFYLTILKVLNHYAYKLLGELFKTPSPRKEIRAETGSCFCSVSNCILFGRWVL